MVSHLSVFLLTLATATGISGCVATQPQSGANQTETTTPSDEDETLNSQVAKPTALSGPLWRLIQAPNPVEYADSHNFTYSNGSVLVIIELPPNASLPDGPGIAQQLTHTTDDHRIVQAYFPLGNLTSLAEIPRIQRIRKPIETTRQGATIE